MLGKNNYQEKTRQLRKQDKRERFSIRKLAIGAASVLLGFSFLMGSKENVKADTIPSDPSASVSKADNAAKNTDKPTDTQKATTDHSSAKPKLSTYAGLQSFLRTSPSDDEHNSSAEQVAPGEDPANAPEVHESSDNHQDDSAIVDQPDNPVSSSPVDPEQAKELEESATYLETEIGKGQEFVENAEFKAADSARQTALTTAISAGQDLLTRYQASTKDIAPVPTISLKDGGTPATLEELNAASKQIEQAINDIKNPISTRSDHTWNDGDCVLVYDAANKTLHVKAGENGNTLGDGGYYHSFSHIVNGDTGYYGPETYRIEKLVFDDNVVLPANASYKFEKLGNLKEIDGLDKVDTSKVTSMALMFAYDRALTSLDVSSFDTSKVTNMSWMFYDDNALTSLDISNFDTSNVTDMSRMFYRDSALTSLDVSNFNTSKVTDMSAMFYRDSALTSLDVSNFNTSKVTDMSAMFYRDSALTSLDVSNFDTSKVTNMSSMFAYDSALTSLDLSNFNTSKVTNMSSMFAYDSALTSLDLSNFDTSKVMSMASMFYGDSRLTSLDLGSFDTSNVTSMVSMFYRDSVLTSLDVSNFDTSKVTNMSGMFYDDRALTSLNLSNFDTSKVTNMSSMFYYDRALTSLDVSSFNTSKVMDMSHMFEDDYALTSLDLSNFNTSNVKGMAEMFDGDRALTSLDLSNFDTSNVTTMYQMFWGDSALTSLDLSNFDTSNVKGMSSMFYGDSALTSLDLSNFDTSKVTNMAWMFDGDSALTSLDLSNFDTSKVTDMRYMFTNDSALTSLDVSSFDTNKVTDMSFMFDGDSALTSLDLSNFDTGKVTDMSYMFYNTGNPNRFVLKLGHTNLHGNSGIGTGNHYYIRAVGNGTEDNPTGETYTGQELEDLYNQSPENCPVETYIMSRTSDSATYNPVASTLTVHNLQSSPGDPEDLLNFGDVTIAGLKNQQDVRVPSKKTVDHVEWLPNKVWTSGGLEDGGMIDADGNLRYNVANVAGQRGNAVIEVVYGDGTTDDVPVTIQVIKPQPMQNASANSAVTLGDPSNFISNVQDLQTFNITYKYVDANGKNISNLTLTWKPDHTSQDIHIKVSYYKDAAHTQVDGSEILTVPIRINPQHQNVTVHHYLQGTTTKVPGMTDQTVLGNVNGAVTVSATAQEQQAPAGYTQVTTTDQTSPTITVAGGQEIVFYYTADARNNIKVNYVNAANGNTVFSSNPTGHTGEKLTLDSVRDKIGQQDLAGYHYAAGNELSSTQSQPTASSWTYGADASQEQAVTIYVAGDARNNIKVNYVNAVNGNVVFSDTPTGHTGEELTLDSVKDKIGQQDLAGYHYAERNELSSTQSQPTASSWTYGADASQEQAVTIYVVGNPVTVNVEYQLGNVVIATAPASIAAHIGDSIKVTPDASLLPVGYTLESDEPRTEELTYDNVHHDSFDYTHTIIFALTLNKPQAAKTLTVYQNYKLTDDDAKAAITNYANLAGNVRVVWKNGAPSTSELGTKTAIVTVTSTDPNFASQDVPVTIKVIAKPGLTMADIYHPVGGTIEVPQYTDIPQDSTYAQAGIINNSDMPEGTTYIWERHNGQMPDTSVAGMQRTGFVRVTFPDDSYKSVKVVASVADNVTKDITLKHNAYIYDANGKRANGITLTSGSQIKTYGTKVINGRKFYILDNANYYLAAGNDKPATKKLDHNAYIYNSKGERIDKKHVVNQGGEVKTYGIPVTIKGKEYYSIGNGQYMKKNNFPPTSKWQEPELSAAALAAGHSMKHLAKNAYLYDENGKRSGQLTLKSGSSVEVTGVKTINGEDYYALADGGYIKQSNFAD